MVERSSKSLEKISNINRKIVTMTENEIKELEYITWRGVYSKKVFSFLFKKEVQLSVYAETGEKEKDFTNSIIKSINCFLKIEDDKLSEIKTKIWSHYNACIENASYGGVPDELINKFGNTEANKKYFGCFDENCTYKKSKITEVYFDHFDGESTYCSVFFEVPWEDEHGFAVHFKDGRIDSCT